MSHEQIGRREAFRTFEAHTSLSGGEFTNKLPNQYIRNYYKNYIIETEDFAKYMIKQECCKSFDEIKSKAINYIDTYLDLVCSHTIFKDKNIINVKTMILQLLV